MPGTKGFALVWVNLNAMKSPLLLTAQIGFVAISLVYYFFFLRELRKGIALTGWDHKRKQTANRLIVAVPMLITIVISFWSLSGIMSNFSLFPLNFMPVLLLPMVIALYLTFSSSFNEILKNIAPENIIKLQSFRFFVEILLWLLFIDNTIPIQMSFEGRNFDVLVGITAPFIAWMAATGKISRTGMIIWNILGLCLLINIVSIAVLSLPTPIQVFTEAPVTIVAYFPISFLPGLLVPLAYTLHFFSLRQLLVSRKASASVAH
jgi:hypothetical protein